MIAFEVKFTSFWEVVELHRLDEVFSLLEQAGETSLVRSSTQHLVSKFSSNLNKNAKMSMMMKLSSKRGLVQMDERPCILPDSWFSHIWSMLSILLICYIALTVPYFAAFGNSATLAIAVIDVLLFVFFSVDIFLRLRYFAVLEEGEIVRLREHFSAIYMETRLKWDLISTVPFALIIFGEFVFLNLNFLWQHFAYF